MCITAANGNLKKTKIIAGEDWFVYANEAETKKSNSMLLAIPCKSEKDFTALDGTPWVPMFNQLEKDLPIYVDPNASRGISHKGLSVEQVGMYKCIKGEVSFFREYCEKADFEISPEMVDFFENHYKGWCFLSCEWEGNKKMDEQPIWVRYNSIFKDLIYIPMMDGHGHVPVRGDEYRDHRLAFTCKGNLTGKLYDTPMGPMKFITQAIGENFTPYQRYSNGDAFVEKAEYLSSEVYKGKVHCSFDLPETYDEKLAREIIDIGCR